MQNNKERHVSLCGDSILKGIQLTQDLRYRVDNTVDLEAIGEKLGCTIDNFSHFGCTVTKGRQLIERALKAGRLGEAVVMDFGGNDCDHDWVAIANDPTGEHQPKTPLNVFVDAYRSLIRFLREAGVEPILTTLPPIHSQRFFDWFCSTVNPATVLQWLGDVNAIERFHESYSNAVEELAREEQVRLIDLRSAFLKCDRLEQLLCQDGIHPNSAGQQRIAEAFLAGA